MTPDAERQRLEGLIAVYVTDPTAVHALACDILAATPEPAPGLREALISACQEAFLIAFHHWRVSLPDGSFRHEDGMRLIQMVESRFGNLAATRAARPADTPTPDEPHDYDEDGICPCGAVSADESYRTIACTVRHAPLPPAVAPAPSGWQEVAEQFDRMAAMCVPNGEGSQAFGFCAEKVRVVAGLDLPPASTASEKP